MTKFRHLYMEIWLVKSKYYTVKNNLTIRSHVVSYFSADIVIEAEHSPLN